MKASDLQRIAFLIGKQRPSLLKSYLDLVGNKTLLAYRHQWQWGKKEGESLYTHIINGIFLLDALREVLSLSDLEAQVLFTAYTVHDINKMETEKARAFNKLAVEENIAPLVERLGLPAFFPDWRDYLADIESFIRGHGGSTQTSGEMLVVKRAPAYKLGMQRVQALRNLMKAVDIIDLSHTLDERQHKQTFLTHLNTYLAETGEARQFQLFTHQLTEQRGLFSNILHQAIADELKETAELIPLLYYPDGIVYLVTKGQTIQVDDEMVYRTATRTAQNINSITQSKFQQFIVTRAAGIKVDGKCLELGVPFAGKDSILEELINKVYSRNLVPQALDSKVRDRASRDFEKHAANAPDVADEVLRILEDEASLVAQQDVLLRTAELIRTYYIFLSDHFREEMPDAWAHLYELFGLPPERHSYYSFFEPRYDRSYVLIKDVPLSQDEVMQIIAEDGSRLVGEKTQEDAKTEHLADYLKRYAFFSGRGRPQMSFGDHLEHYINTQHKQCVHCGSPFPTGKWMAGDVRNDITVQVFSNRLRGGPGEPKKYVCTICQLQFLLEKLNYPPVRGEKLLYLHLFPYSFLTAPFIEALRDTFRQITEAGEAVNALNLDARPAIKHWLGEKSKDPRFFRTQTKKGKPQPYGAYVPHYSKTVGNLIILPINAAGDNDTNRFLFALWNALVFQRHFGVKVLLSAASVAPLEKQDFGDLYVDNIPLAVQGLLPVNNYRQFKPDQGEVLDNFPELWVKVQHLFALAEMTFTSDDNTPRLVRALAAHPLMIYHELDRLLVKKISNDQGGLTTWAYQQALPHISTLAQLQGGSFVKKLSTILQQLAEVAWTGHLRGRTLERSSLLFPFNQVMEKMAYLHSSKALDAEVLKAAAAQDIFDHLERLAKQQGYTIGAKRMAASITFVNGWFDNVLGQVYDGNLRKLLADEKLLRSAYLFYLRQQIKSKEDASD
ncbi:MAG: type I-D CRISPR-associated protein Cas10d/Csc3 [Chloroflexi bacterium]|nr:type I-D CRISPR-associated protein Cas10d/Csc3 [Chloroflexota bacterium]